MKHLVVGIMLLCAFSNWSANADEQHTPEKVSGALDHIGLAVSDLDASTNFFIDVLGFSVSGRDAQYPSVFMNNGQMRVTLWQTSGETVAFNRKSNVGLHHLAIRVASFEVLDALYQQVQKISGVVVEFSPELANGGPAKHMMIREPSGNRLELIYRP